MDRIERFLYRTLTRSDIKKENLLRDQIVQEVCDIVGPQWQRVDELLAAPIWEFDDKAHRETRGRWFVHGLEEALLAITYSKFYKLNLSRYQLDEIAFGHIAHDIGKSESVDPDAWNKSDWELTQGDVAGMRSHVFKGVEMIDRLKSVGVKIPLISEHIMKFHHERLDGSGPYKLRDEQIPFEARLAACVDSVVSRAENHSYQPNAHLHRFSMKSASDDVYAHRGSRFDPDIVTNLHRLQTNNLIYHMRVMEATSGWWERAYTQGDENFPPPAARPGQSY
jgi:response regulator RpfG family c-di-GMP phosphodiesterase